MRLSLDALETLDAIEEAGSFARAAERLHRVPSALTYTVNKLESDLGVAIFDRSGKRAVLTAAGRELLEQGRELLRQAESLERRIKRVAQGWETQLTIAVDEALPLDRLFPLLSEFDAQRAGTRIRFIQEIFGGTWDALIDRRADLAVCAPGEVPAGFGICSREIGRIDFVYVVAPFHPLAEAPDPLPSKLITRYRAVVAADSSRRIPGRSSGVLANQETLIVPTLIAKLQAQVAGLGVGYLPAYMAEPEIAAGRLVVKHPELTRESAPAHIGWREAEEGRAGAWFRERVIAEAEASRLFPQSAPAATANSAATAAVS
ncbi:MAG: LysR family transcriptional regulator [Hydrocarboniphaga sp.]|uniref:LysR substrate-binding domain-containing protein n=1 Tax=Hydrocarboniphaga sp. TaxID=2033016 RepID=UPI002625E6A5|nr:LysR substrate-binding domain-containing protein [Hydrocarboniphaga sp.]MDB5972138.1 LysR family transcriptional regulator [Hydrocarboniphaga sp.]